MSKQGLEEAVRKLEQELQDTRDLDPGLRNQLAEVGREIDGALRGEHEGEGIAEKLQDLLLELEASHPTLTSVVDAITRQLSRLGI